MEPGHQASTKSPAVQLRGARHAVPLKPAIFNQEGLPADSGRNVRVKLTTGHIADVAESSLRYRDGLREKEITTDNKMIVAEDVGNQALSWLTRPSVSQQDFREQVPAPVFRVMDYYVLDRDEGGDDDYHKGTELSTAACAAKIHGANPACVRAYPDSANRWKMLSLWRRKQQHQLHRHLP